ncbi:response regulator transcription factor [Allobacillus sp. SKP2-8]|uniref:response regulator transcription factor n=1 Tax=unclassified Allobacillus TaxID=2628859 RepID=UPI0011836495|nr:response regulator transcription factor [Allobacillus sp. SKP2-8]TSJ68405.1 response regulator transcription factor [Allobacillus sp. SKP2-8]
MDRRILIVDDEDSITTLIEYNLEQEGYETVVYQDGKQAYEAAKNDHFDLIVLDLMLPSMDGMEICQKLRQDNIHTPIIMLTAKRHEQDMITGLEYGADDYMTKPFSPKELVTRVKVVLRRTQPVEESGKQIRLAHIRVDPETYEVFKEDELVEFTKKEFDLLIYLVKRKNKPVPRAKLLKDVWDFDFVGDTRIVDVHISHLREKLELDPKKPTLIKTVRGIGYKIEG